MSGSPTTTEYGRYVFVHDLTYDDVTGAARRIAERIRPVTMSPQLVVPGDRGQGSFSLGLALEQMQHTGSFKARGAQNFLAAHLERGSVSAAGVTIASGGNAGLACAWAAEQAGVVATVFLPATAPEVKVAKLRSFGATLHLVGSEFAEALAACEEFASETGSLACHSYDDPLVAAGAGTIVLEILAQIPDLDTIVVAVGGGGLLAGVATVAQHHGLRTVAVEPENCRALNAAVEVGHLVDVPVASIAADALGARRASAMALHAAQNLGVRSIVVSDAEIIRTRQALWDGFHLVVEYGAATALAGLPAFEVDGADPGRTSGYLPGPGESIAVVLCGANTDPSDLVHRGDS
jgi:threonine dehydratase